MRSSNRLMSFPAGTMVTVKGYPFVLRDAAAVMGTPENFGEAVCELAKAEQMEDQAMDGLVGVHLRVRAPNAETVAALEEALATGKGKIAPVANPDLVYDENGLLICDKGNKPGFSYLIDCDFGRIAHITFHTGPVSERGLHGLTNEALLAILIHRTNILNEQFPCNENSEAIALMTKAKHVFESRTKRRQAAGIDGKHVELSAELPTTLRSMADSE